MILEALVSTVDAEGGPHVTPMGPHMGQCTFQLMPFNTSTTYANLARHPEGVLHVTDNALMLARAAIGKFIVPTRPAKMIHGYIIEDCCRAVEFRAVRFDESRERVVIDCEPVLTHTLREFWGFNRGKHAVVEAAILATRLHMLPRESIETQYAQLQVLVDKTGGDDERAAMALLTDHCTKFWGGHG